MAEISAEDITLLYWQFNLSAHYDGWFLEYLI